MPQKTQKILLDTNFLLVPTQHKVDIFAEFDRILSFPYKLFILDQCVDELKKLADANTKTALSAKIALQLIKDKSVKVLETSEKQHPDNIILTLNDYIVATRDMELIKKLKQKSFKTITLRQKSHLVLVEP